MPRAWHHGYIRFDGAADMEDEMARYLKITVDTGFVGATHEDECELPGDWDDMTKDQQEEYMNRSCEEAVWNYIDAYAEVVDDE